jgi:hypothetical protein
MAETKNNLDNKQKLALAGLAVFGIFLVILWVFKLDSEIKAPLAYKTDANNSASSTVTATDKASEEKLKNQDTDNDSLSDWDEINVYHTSPYLPDSDSDGIPDGTEVKNGTDPNCPQGQTCNVPAATTQTATANAGADTSSGSGAASSTASSSINSKLLSGQIDTASLRQLLINSGVSKTDLDQISDADLLAAYKTQLASTTKK